MSLPVKLIIKGRGFKIKHYIQKQLIEKNRFSERAKGLIGVKQLPSHQALLIFPCRQVHTWFMKFPILTIYLTKECQVLWIGILKPWKIGPYYHNGHFVLETTDYNLIHLINIGDDLTFSKD